MKKIVKNINLLICLLACLILIPACTDDNELSKTNQAFGYFQLKLTKAQSKGITAGNELENLKDAKKVQVDLLFDNRQITQTLNLLSVSDDAAEFGLSSESMQLLTGNYTLTAYRIYGEYVEGSTAGDKAPVLQEGEPDEPMNFVVEEQKLTLVALDIVAQLRGKLSLIIGKDFSNIQPSRAGYDPDNFNYNQIASVQVDMKAGLSGPTREYVFKTWRAKNDYLFHTDTISLRENNYTVNQVRLLDKNKKLIMVIDQPSSIEIKNQIHSRDTVSIDMPLTPAFNDYIALYNIWKKMDGENWYWNGMGFKEGANWLFRYSDGTPRPLDMWGAQPGVTLDGRGRVTAMTIGGFNPKGMLPDEIGQLTELQNLYLGNHSDAAQIDPEQGMLVVDKSELQRQGVDIFANRLDIAKEAIKLRYPAKASSISYKSSGASASMKYARPYFAHDHTGYSNRITGISPEISKCKQLSVLTVANNLVTDLPESLSELPNLTDLELYSLSMTQIPECVTRMENLVAFNFSRIKGLDYPKFMDSFERFCESGSNKTMQILYMNENSLTTLPENLSKMVNLGLLDFSANKIETLPMLGPDVSLVQCLLNDNKIKHIPDNWFVTDDLEKLLADNNQITTFPNLFSSKSKFQVEEVSLEGNQISSFSDNFKGVNIEILNLNANKLTKFPEEFSKTTSTVNFLRMTNNQIDSISPASIEDFKSLSALEMKGNNLKYIPAEFDLKTLPYLTGLDLSFNSFARFPYAVLYCQLAELRISDQYDRQTGKKSLREWPEGVDQQPTLRVLDISNNDIRKVSNFPVMLNYLAIQGNTNISITVPYDIFREMLEGTFKLLFDEDQDVNFQN
ncbi:MAG: DUF4458 domain-containing protein [Bacteroidales bacterium]